MNYTVEQEQAISLRDRDILVSAGAGAGKTRVLVSRIADMIVDQSRTVRADQFLVMTFTNAAAAEMRERIHQELDERLDKNPENRYLLKQIHLLKQADISTVHSFCSRLLRTHFSEAGIDPAFRVGEDGEMKLLREQAMAELMEEAYQKHDQGFLDLVEAYAPEKDDTPITEMIESLYTFSRSFPDADRWYQQIFEIYRNTSDEEDFEQSFYVQNTIRYARRVINRHRRAMESFGERVPSEDWQDKFYLSYQNDLKVMDDLLACQTYQDWYGEIATAKLGKKPTNSKRTPFLYDSSYKNLRDRLKEDLKKLQKSIFWAPMEDITDQCQKTKPYVEELIQLTQRYEEIYFADKQDQNVYDFDDLEHLSMKLLVKGYDQDGKPVPTEIALSLQERYREIFVDEYQDTSLLQETLIEVLHDQTKNELFVVGDVKQSIYRFRQARPDLFLNRYDSYLPYDEKNQDSKSGVRIELRDNFRSQPNVLHLCNDFFHKLMTRDFGGIDYDESVELRKGVGGPMESGTTKSEVDLLIEDEEKDEIDGDTEFITVETAMIARHIRKLVEDGYHYSDIVILLRSAKGWSDKMADLLTGWGIPAAAESKTGYFQTIEVSLVLSYLSVIDNVYQDIPMASVLLSSIGQFSEDELSRLEIEIDIRERRRYYLYDYLEKYLSEGKDTVLLEKTRHFLTLLHHFQEKKKETPLSDLIWEIYQKTGIYYDVQLLPEGERRKENLLMLLKKAEDYERTVFRGLFYFLRYINQLKTYELDYGLAPAAGGEEDLVKVMTIHSSKGLEFPVVFAAGFEKQFNRQDEKKQMLLHPRFGVGLDYIDLKNRERHGSAIKDMIRHQIRQESMEEELRVLYVAMTRAKEKLILSSVVSKKAVDSLLESRVKDKETANSTLDWMLGCLKDTGPFQKFLNARRASEEERIADDSPYELNIYHYHELTPYLEDKEEVTKAQTLSDFLDSYAGEESLPIIERAFAYQYPYQEDTRLKRKYSVSELKRVSMTEIPSENTWEESETTDYKKEDLEEEIPVPNFLKEEEIPQKPAVGANRGTIVHKVFELLPFHKIKTRGDLSEALDVIEKDYPPAKTVNRRFLEEGAAALLFSPTGELLRKEEAKGNVFREQPFTVGIPADELDPEKESRELIVIQGVIDCYLLTERGILLLDYKTDYLKKGEESTLLDRYQSQMLYYKLALEQITGIRVDKVLIYSVYLRKFIPVLFD